MTTSDRHLVLLHAYPLNRTMWTPQIEGLRDIVSVHAFNLPGFGGEPGFDGQELTMARMAEFVEEQMTANGIDHCILGGLSMGGYVAFECLRLFGTRIDGLVLADTRADADSRQIRIGRRASAERVGRGDVDGYIDDLLVTVLGPATRRDKPEIVASVREMMAVAPPTSIIAALLGMAARRDSSEILPSVAIPVSLIFGADDGITTVAEGRLMYEAFPDATLTVIEDAGHLANLEQPEEFNRAVRDLISRVADNATH